MDKTENFLQETHQRKLSNTQPLDEEGQSKEFVEIETNEELFYGVEDIPAPHLCLLFGFQQALLCIGGSLNVPFILADLLCVVNMAEVTAELLSITMFMCGVATLVQTTFGVRLPIVQGGSHVFIAPVIAMMAFRECPDSDQISVIKQSNSSEDTIRELWQSRMREVAGGLALSSLFQIIMGCFGIVGFLLKYIGPLTIAPTISLIGLSLTKTATKFNQVHWGLACLTMALIGLFSLFIGRINVPCVSYSNEEKWHIKKIPIFRLLAVIFSTGIVWIVCHVLTVTDALPNNSTATSYNARTDARLSVLDSTPWFYFPYPCQFGLPTITLAGFCGMLASTIASTIESVGDYYACARLANTQPPPPHAINRGIVVEGVCSVFSGLVGAGHPTTSYSGNIGAIGLTKVASRRVFQICAIILVLGGVLGKCGAVLALIPTPIIGGTSTVLFGMVAAVGISVLQFIDLSSIRNLTILGFSYILGLGVPEWISQNGDKINTGYGELDQVIRVLLGTAMFVGGVLGFILDNIVPGTPEERGILKWRENTLSPSIVGTTADADVYELPLITKTLKNIQCCSYVPISPTFSHQCEMNCCKRKSNTENSQQNHFHNGSFDPENVSNTI